MPCSRHFSWSPGIAYAVSAMIGSGGSSARRRSALRMYVAAS